MLHILVMDTATARLFMTAGPHKPLVPVCEFVNPAGRAHERDLVSSRPGRVFNRVAGIHQAFEPAMSARNHALVAWLRSLLKPLQSVMRTYNSEGLVLVAAPRLLAAGRRTLGKQLTVRAEFARNLTHLPPLALGQRLQATLKTVRTKARAA